ncbi:MAG: helix-turn-helix domain-containing protein [Qipengyuania sp.]|nr:helix-turn-helix domain-containing protein [Qipengyuania sp.]
MGPHAGHKPNTAIVKITAVEAGGLRLHIVPPPPDLAPYVSLFYRTDVAPGHVFEDCVPPEWANLRAGRSPVYEAAIGSEAMRPVPETIISGPTTQAVRLRIGEGEYWGLGLLPLGFARFLGIPASDYANRFRDIAAEPAAEPFRLLLEKLLHSPMPVADGAALMTETLRGLPTRRLPQADAIIGTHKALVSDLSRSVANLAREVGTSTRTLERFCCRNFGFNPQLLLRRQRFLRSLASFMVDPTMKWIHTLDSHYHDQAHFVRDFREFMGMTPSDYAAMDHPITMTAVRARRAARAEAMQVLHEPDPRPLEPSAASA